MNADNVLVLSPFESPDPRLVAAACRAGAVGILDLGRDLERSRDALAMLTDLPKVRFGVRVPEGVAVDVSLLPENVGIVVLTAGASQSPWHAYRKLIQVTSLDEALDAEAAGADGLIAKGIESGGRVGDDTAFVLLQRLAGKVSLPVWVQGGVGIYTAAGCFAGGAAGVVLDSQLALLKESSLSEEIRTTIAAMDGSETAMHSGHRIYTRPDLPISDLVAAGVTTNLGAAGLRENLLPAGADAAFAKAFEERFHTVGGVVRGLSTAVQRQLQSARKGHFFTASGGLARQHNLRHAVFQGPMTRVSDSVAFADAVSGGGGLPFLALALMRGPEVERLLTQAAVTLEGRSWGVGILGFVPPELREEQLEVVRRIKPPVALIAGGRPSQATELEAVGITTYLHVPSPGLLDLFLTQGAKHFIFEGSECGGHVGPRTSFVLWESQIQRLLKQPRLDGFSLLFAGGIHDAKSAAMLAAMIAPLAERGANVGALMGTAYLFTEEAVAAGAITLTYQQSALACERTVLLETAPGHATRCAETPFVQLFRSEKLRMEAEGLPPQEVWGALETLNLGRLRIASKGLQREGAEVITVDEETQRREGMVMLGDVASLQHGVSTIERLHDDISHGSQAVLAALDLAEHDGPRAKPADIAIIGMAAIMPGAGDLDTFWANIVRGTNNITEVPSDRWNVDLFFDPDSMDGEMSPSKWGGFIDPVAFDPLTYGIPPRSLAAIEPVQLLALEVSRRALADSGYLDKDFDKEHTSVIFGAEAGNDLASAYGFRALWRQYAGELPRELDEVLPRMTEDSFPGILSNVISGRIANRLDLGGSNFTVDAACASSLAAVDLACRELAAGASNLAICGGSDVHNGITDYLAFSSVHALSPSGQCRTFDADADGISLGEGVGAIILKRLADAERDGDRIYAVIKGVGSSSDGRSLGLTAPRPEGQARALERAYAHAGLSPANVGLIEAHGTGTVVGDRTEIETLSEVFRRYGAEPGNCALGSVKSQIGHTKCAAGIAGMIKAAKSLYHRVLPPTVNIETPNPAWGENSPFILNTEARPWVSEQRVAGVSAFGFGGTNYHVVLAEAASDELPPTGATWPAELFLLRGANLDAARNEATRLIDLIGRVDEPSLRDLAYTTSRKSGVVQVSVIAADLDDLEAKLQRVLTTTADSEGVFFRRQDAEILDGKVAFLFPGQGSQKVGMLRDIFLAFPHLQRYLDQDEALASLIYPGPAWGDDATKAQRDALTDTRAAQPALGMVELALNHLLQDLNVRPDMLGGHSYAELVALAAAGVIKEDDLVAISRRRAESIIEAIGDSGDPGTMAAVSAGYDAVASVIDGLDRVVAANRNSPEQTVVSGPTAGVLEAISRFKDAGIAATRIPVACAFHSPLVSPASALFAEDLARLDLNAGTRPVYSNTTAAVHDCTAEAMKMRLAEHIGMPVRFTEEIEAMYEAGARIFVEVGPGRVMSRLVAQILAGKPHVTVTTETNPRNGLKDLLNALGLLASCGMPVDLAPLFAGRDVKEIDLRTPGRTPSATSWWVNGHLAWPMNGEAPENGLKPILKPVIQSYEARPTSMNGHSNGTANGNGNGHVNGDGDRDSIVLEYLRSTRDLIETQRQVMLSYLGEPPAAPVLQAWPSNGHVVEAAPSRLVIEAAAPAVPATPAPVVAVVEAQVAVVVEKPQAPEINIEKMLLDLVAERTGYPIEMLGLDLDLEADLSVDSIKRVEIIGTITQRLGVANDTAMKELPEDLVQIKTLRRLTISLSEWTTTRGGGAATIEAPVQRQIEAPIEAAKAAPPVVRYVPILAPTGGVDSRLDGLNGLNISVYGGTAEGKSLVLTLNAAHAEARLLADDEEPAKVDGLVDVTSFGEDWQPGDVMGVFARVRAALVGGAKRVVVASPIADAVGGNGESSNGLPPGGLSGLVKTFAKEWPDRVIRAVHFQDTATPAEVAEHVARELLSNDGAAEVAYISGVRRVQRASRADLVTTAAAFTLEPGNVVLITGGARGVTPSVAREMAKRFGSRLVLAGRTPLPETNGSTPAHVQDMASLRREMAASGKYSSPSEIEAAASAAFGQAEVLATLNALKADGVDVAYYAVDVRNPEAMGGLIESIYERYGRLDGVIHAAGTIEDKLAKDKTFDSFRRVYETKVLGALTIASQLREDVKFLAFFSSVSGVFGNRGQVDYAAANDFLDKLAIYLNARHPGRILSVAWGPWSGAGMVSPELAAQYAKAGVDLIDLDLGAQSFVDELLYGSKADPQVILSASDLKLFA